MGSAQGHGDDNCQDYSLCAAAQEIDEKNKEKVEEEAQKQKQTIKAGAPRTPIKGPPNTTVKYPNGTERQFGPDGNAVKDIDTRGHPHDPEPHAHDWDHSGPKPQRGGRRDLTPEEKKEIENGAKKVIIVGGAGALIQTIIQAAPELLPFAF